MLYTTNEVKEMIQCNLAVLLAERQFKITRVAIETGISRTTLTSLAGNNSQGVQFDTIDTLCLYLNVSPSDLLEYVPIGISVKRVDTNFDFTRPDLPHFDTVTIYIEITSNKSKRIVELSGEMTYSVFVLEQQVANIFIEISSENNEDESESAKIYQELSQLPITFRRSIANQIAIQLFKDNENDVIGLNTIDVSFAGTHS